MTTRSGVPCSTRGFVRPGRPSTPEAALARLLDALDSISPAQVLEVSDDVALGAEEAAVHSAHYWQPPDDDDRVYARPDVRPALPAIAEALTESPHTRSWGDPVDLEKQCAVRYQLDDDKDPNRRPSNDPIDLHAWRTTAVEEEANAQRHRPSDPAAHYGGSWWSSPVFTGALQTTKAIAGPKNMRLGLVEDWVNCERLLIWPVTLTCTIERDPNFELESDSPPPANMTATTATVEEIGDGRIEARVKFRRDLPGSYSTGNETC